MIRIILILRFVLAAVFIIAGVLKALDPATFATDVLHYRLIGHSAATAVALYLPWLEVTCGIALFIPAWSRPATTILLTLMIIFTLALLSAWLRGINLHCGCLGDHLSMPLGWSLVRNAVLIALLFYLSNCNDGCDSIFPWHITRFI